MGFWARVKKDLPVGMRGGINAFKEGAAVLSRETRRMAKSSASVMSTETRRMAQVSKLRYQRLRLSQKAQDKLTEIGGRVYDLASQDLKGLRLDPELKTLIAQAKELEEGIKELEAKIQVLSKKDKGKKTANQEDRSKETQKSSKT